MSHNAIYTDLSGYYDLMCADIDYPAQGQCVQRIHQLFGNGGKRHLDLACGTGPHVRHFLDAGFQSSGLDINQPMLDLALQRQSITAVASNGYAPASPAFMPRWLMVACSALTQWTKARSTTAHLSLTQCANTTPPSGSARAGITQGRANNSGCACASSAPTRKASNSGKTSTRWSP